MIEFEDLTSLDLDEFSRFHDYGWYLGMITYQPASEVGFVIRSDYTELFYAQICGKTTKTILGAKHSFDALMCSKKKSHKGDCACWLPTPEDLANNIYPQPDFHDSLKVAGIIKAV